MTVINHSSRARALLLAGTVWTVFIVMNGGAKATCDGFGKSPSPTTPIISPVVEDLPFGKFVWGTEAYPDSAGHWWVGDYVRNADDAPPLALSWARAGIDRSLMKPLQRGEPVCKSHFVGSLIKEPVPDPDAPILYYVNRQTDAVVYAKEIDQSGARGGDTSGRSGAPPAKASGQSGVPPGDASGGTGTRIETTITNQKGESQPISFEFTMQRDGDNIRIFLKSSGHFRVGLPDFSTILGPSNTEQVQMDLKKYGIEATRAPLYKFADSEGLKALFWSHDAPAGIEKLDTLFLFDGEQTRKAFSDLKIGQNSNIQTKSGLVLVFDDRNTPVLSATIDYSVPVPK